MESATTNRIFYHIVMVQVVDTDETFLFHPILERERQILPPTHIKTLNESIWNHILQHFGAWFGDSALKFGWVVFRFGWRSKKVKYEHLFNPKQNTVPEFKAGALNNVRMENERYIKPVYTENTFWVSLYAGWLSEKHDVQPKYY